MLISGLFLLGSSLSWVVLGTPHPEDHQMSSSGARSSRDAGPSLGAAGSSRDAGVVPTGASSSALRVGDAAGRQEPDQKDDRPVAVQTPRSPIEKKILTYQELMANVKNPSDTEDLCDTEDITSDKEDLEEDPKKIRYFIKKWMAMSDQGGVFTPTTDKLAPVQRWINQLCLPDLMEDLDLNKSNYLEKRQAAKIMRAQSARSPAVRTPQKINIAQALVKSLPVPTSPEYQFKEDQFKHINKIIATLRTRQRKKQETQKTRQWLEERAGQQTIKQAQQTRLQDKRLTKLVQQTKNQYRRIQDQRISRVAQRRRQQWQLMQTWQQQYWRPSAQTQYWPKSWQTQYWPKYWQTQYWPPSGPQQYWQTQYWSPSGQTQVWREVRSPQTASGPEWPESGGPRPAQLSWQQSGESLPGPSSWQ